MRRRLIEWLGGGLPKSEADGVIGVVEESTIDSLPVQQWLDENPQHR